MKTYGLIGYPLSHSFSPGYFKNKFYKENIPDTQYLSFPLEKIEHFEKLIHSTQNLIGLNVTIPYKESVIPYLDNLDDTAKAIGAVNTIKIKNQKLIGYNTDVIGFEKSLKPLLHNNINSALILGTGGASKAVAYVLNRLGIKFQFVSRKKSNNTITYNELYNDIFKTNLLIINTTPLGMSPHVEQYPDIPYQLLSNKHILYDLIYNPTETVFLQKGKSQGALIKNGLEMLHLQADSSWEIWNS